jgi:hypothetical protein
MQKKKVFPKIATDQTRPDQTEPDQTKPTSQPTNQTKETP